MMSNNCFSRIFVTILNDRGEPSTSSVVAVMGCNWKEASKFSSFFFLSFSQFHQHFMCEFFIRKCFAKLFSTVSLAL